MIPAITAVWEWLSNNLGNFLSGFWGLARKVKWFAVSLVLVVITALEYLIAFFGWSASTFSAQTFAMAGQVKGFVSTANPGNTWSALQSGAALANCVVPLDYMLATGGVVIGVWVGISMIQGLIRLWQLIPFKAT